MSTLSVIVMLWGCFSSNLNGAEITIRVGEHMIGLLGSSREDVSVVMTEELKAILRSEQPLTDARTDIELPVGWNDTIHHYQQGRPVSRSRFMEFYTPQTRRREELLGEVSDLTVYGELTSVTSRHSPIIYVVQDMPLLLRTEPTANLVENGLLLDHPESALSAVLNNPGQYNLLEALMAAHSYLVNCYREARLYNKMRGQSDLNDSQALKHWVIEDLVLIIHVINQYSETSAGAVAAATLVSALWAKPPTTPVADSHAGAASSHKELYEWSKKYKKKLQKLKKKGEGLSCCGCSRSGEEESDEYRPVPFRATNLSGDRFWAQCLSGQANVEFQRYTEFVADIVTLYRERLCRPQNAPYSDAMKQVMSDLELLTDSIRRLNRDSKPEE